MDHISIPVIKCHVDLPSWGRAVLLFEREGTCHYLFEDGVTRKISKGHADKMVPVALTEAEAVALDAKIRSRQSPEPPSRPGTPGPSRRVKAPPPPRMGFEEQLKRFLTKYKDGFQDEEFIHDERGALDSMGRLAYKERAMRDIRQLLGPDARAWEDPDAVYAHVMKLCSKTNLVARYVGQQWMSRMLPVAKPEYARCLRELLHGEGEYAARFDAYVESIRCTLTDGAPWPPTWQFATYLTALYYPDTHVVVTPTRFVEQAAIVGLVRPRIVRPLRGEDYQRFLEVAQETHRQLEHAGLRPRDLMDTYSFIWVTLKGEKGD